MTDVEFKARAKEKAEFLTKKHKSKEHALITVNEILESFGVSLSDWQREFWEIVKQELKFPDGYVHNAEPDETQALIGL